MSPENQWLEDVFPIEIVPFLGDMLVFGGVNTIVWTCCFHHDFENHRDPVVYQGREDKVMQVMSCYHLIITCIRYVCPLGCLRFEEVAESHLGCKKKKPLKSCRIYEPSFKRFARISVNRIGKNCAPKMSGELPGLRHSFRLWLWPCVLQEMVWLGCKFLQTVSMGPKTKKEKHLNIRNLLRIGQNWGYPDFWTT